MNIQERLNLERENVQLKKELSVLKRKMELLESNRSLNSFSQHLIDKMQAIIFIKDVTNGFAITELMMLSAPYNIYRAKRL